MPKQAERDTRGEIIDLAKNLVQTLSFNWLSYQDLSDRLKIRKASVHYHFPTKAQLGAEIVKDYRKGFQDWSEKVRAKSASPVVRLEAYFELFRKILGDAERVCPTGAFSLEWNTLPEEIKTELRDLIADHRKFLEETLRTGRKSGEIKDTGSIDDQIAWIGSSLQGAMQIARVQGAPAVFNKVVRQIKALVLVTNTK